MVLFLPPVCATVGRNTLPAHWSPEANEEERGFVDGLRPRFLHLGLLSIKNAFEDGQWAIMEWHDPLGLCGCGFFHIVNGQIVLQRGYWDKLSFLRQRGLPIVTEHLE